MQNCQVPVSFANTSDMQRMGREPLNHASMHTLLEVAASEVFLDIPRQGLMTLGKHIHAELDKGASMPQIVVALAESVLGDLADEAKLTLLRKRLPHQSDYRDVLEEVGPEEVLDDPDLHGRRQHQQGSLACKSLVQLCVNLRRRCSRVQEGTEGGGLVPAPMTADQLRGGRRTSTSCRSLRT